MSTTWGHPGSSQSIFFLFLTVKTFIICGVNNHSGVLSRKGKRWTGAQGVVMCCPGVGASSSSSVPMLIGSRRPCNLPWRRLQQSGHQKDSGIVIWADPMAAGPVLVPPALAVPQDPCHGGRAAPLPPTRWPHLQPLGGWSRGAVLSLREMAGVGRGSHSSGELPMSPPATWPHFPIELGARHASLGGSRDLPLQPAACG